MKSNRITTHALTALALLCAAALSVSAQDAVGEADYAVFVSQREGAAELYLLDLNTRQVSQLTETGRAHLTPAASLGTRSITFAARAGGSYELFTATLSAAWRSRRPLLVGLNRLTTDTTDQVSPTISRDGGFIAFASGNGIELMNADTAACAVVVVAKENFRDYSPALAPDGRQIAFISNRGGTDEIWLAEVATGKLRQLTADAQPQGGMSWSADGRQLVFTTTNTASKLSGIAVADATSGNFRVLTERGDSNPALAPRGDRVIFTSLRDGDPELYLLNVNTGAVERLTHSAGLDDGAIFITSPAMPRR